MITFALIALLSTPQAPAAAAPELHCSKMEVYNVDEEGNGKFEPMDLTVGIYAAEAGGHVAYLFSGDGKKEIKDVKLTTEAADEGRHALAREVSELFFPNVKWEQVSELRIGNVGVEANLQDAAGIMVFEMLSAEKAVLGKFATVGWGFARCGE